MSRDATGLWSGWAQERSTCPVCRAKPGERCNLTRLPNDDDNVAEHGVHWGRTEAYTETENHVRRALQRQSDVTVTDDRLTVAEARSAITQEPWFKRLPNSRRAEAYQLLDALIAAAKREAFEESAREADELGSTYRPGESQRNVLTIVATHIRQRATKGTT